MPTIHLPIGGSTAARTLQCPAWLGRAKKAPKGGSSPAADKGTLFHEVMENFYRDDTLFVEQLNVTKYQGYTFDEDMLSELVEPAYIAAETILDAYGIDELVIEPFVQYVDGLAGGSIDMLGISDDGKTVMVLDWKGGYNHVKAKDNAQLMFYALAAAVDKKVNAFNLKTVERFVGVIIQPKVSRDADAWEFTPDELKAFKVKVDTAIKDTQETEPPAATGKHCQYCPAAPFCPEKKTAARSALLLDTAQTIDLTQALAVVDELEDWVKDIRKTAHDLLEQGAQVPGWKLVQKRASRVWVDPVAVEDKIRKSRKVKLEQGFTLKLKSPAQIEKLCKELKYPFKSFAAMQASVSSGTTLAKESDKRPAVAQKEIPATLLKLVADS